ncbi:MAG: Membrane proteins related to metalloendopeptidases [uncultured Sulfurovum sp.]|uniref:Membrane proteins related to metalloendopeptidases n=1 Tax=uncultured Sulfurovum sp. TaxID=269237 RepID=A0A6S6TNC8_9BACT|nr:MAG: Membrane proteins related to metalloendopeptidases [uncultured Sulfurovum sp.]
MFTSLFAAKVTESKWKEGQTFSEYLESRDISTALLNDISEDDQKFLSDIGGNNSFYELKDNRGRLLQVLIPISEVMQIHLAKKHKEHRYSFDIIPIEYEIKEYYANVNITSNPYTDTFKTTKNKQVAERLSIALSDVVNAKKLHKNDEINVLYTQNLRMGKPYLMPDIKVARVVMSGKEQFVYVDEDGDGFGQVGKSVAYTVTGKKKVTYTKKVSQNKKNSRFGMPLRNIRITSHFTYRRWHPILKRYRPHHGTDFGAKSGTPLLAVNAGKVSFSGWMGGYGNVVKIRHAGGYESLYAHQSRRRVKRGQRVKKGQIIGYVGSTGRSTGPHLHFGLKKRGRWVNPMKVLRKKSIKTSVLKKFTKYEDVKTTKYKTVAIEGTKENKVKLLNYVKNNTPSHVWSH